MSKNLKGILLIANGTPTSDVEIETYYSLKNEGQKPKSQTVEEFKKRIQLVSEGKSLNQMTEELGKELEEKLNTKNNGEYKTYIAYHAISPGIEESLEKMKKDGVTEAISIVLVPQYSTLTVKFFNEQAKNAAKKQGIELQTINNWYKEDRLIWYWANGIREIYDQLSFEAQEESVVIFSAPSLPDSIVDHNDPYPHQVEEMAFLIADAAGIFNHDIGWQSEGDTVGPWLAPDVEDLTRILYYEMGHRTFIYAPIGYVQEHVEVLYDLDIRTRAVCNELGADYHRVKMPNTDPMFIEALANVIINHEK